MSTSEQAGRPSNLEKPVSHASIRGSPTAEEEAAILAALERLLRRESEARALSKWKTAGRALGTRNGVLDYRNRFGSNGWSASRALPWAGQRYDGRHGRGETK